MIFFLIAAFFGAAQAGEIYVFCPLPTQRFSVSHENWKRFADWVGAKIGARLELRMLSEDDFDRALESVSCDIAMLQSDQAASHAYVALVRSSKPTRGILVARKHGGLDNLRSLAGKPVGLPAHDAFAASLLDSAQLNPRPKLKYLSTHANVYRHVIYEKVAAGIGLSSTLEREPPRIRNRIRIIGQTDTIARSPLAMASRFSEEHRAKIVKTVLQLAETEEGGKLLQDLDLADPVPAKLSEYKLSSGSSRRGK